MTPVFERAKTVHALDREANVIGACMLHAPHISSSLIGPCADHSGMNCLSSLERWDRTFKSHLTHGCLCAFVLCLCCSVCR
jgi:hypothetical protein